MHTISERKLVMLKPEEIKKSAFCLRKSFDKYEMKMLAKSIASSGIIQPLVVRRDEEGRYELIAGRRRLEAAVMAGLRRIPCAVHKIDTKTAALYEVVENLKVSPLSVFEEARALQRLIIDFNFSLTEISARLGIEETEITEKLRLLRMGEEIVNKLESAKLDERYALLLLRLPSFKRLSSISYIIEHSLDFGEAKSYIEKILNPENPPTEEKPIRRAVIGDIRLFSNSLEKLVDTLKVAGVTANSRRNETDKYIEYKVRITKEPTISSAQLKIC